MRKFDPNASSESREINEKQNDGPNREDSDRSRNEGYSRFAKDKRKRIVRVEKNPKPAEEANGGYKERSTERRSYNPNFTHDNRKKNNDNNNRYGYEKKDRPYQSRSDAPERRYDKKDDRRDERSYGSKPARRDNNKGRKPYDKRSSDRIAKPFTPGDSYPKFPTPEIESEIRLNRYLSMSGICSRREADELIASGKVTVNGEVVTELGTKVQPNDVVKYNDSVVQGESKVYIVMNKPKGYVTTLDDPHADKIVMDLIKGSVKERVYPVGRLDKNSLGVLLITNDGDLTKKLTHPTYAKKKIYQVTLDKALTKADMQQIVDGIMLDDGEIHADHINYVSENHKEIGIEIHSGRNRIIRRIFEHLGYQVQKLDRVYFAGLTKKNIRRGAWRFLTPREVAALHSGRYE